MVTFARCSNTSLTEKTGKGRKIGASLVVFCKDAVRHSGRCLAAHTETMLSPVWVLLVMQGKKYREV